jgi:hypothetical protein
MSTPLQQALFLGLQLCSRLHVDMRVPLGPIEGANPKPQNKEIRIKPRETAILNATRHRCNPFEIITLYSSKALRRVTCSRTKLKQIIVITYQHIFQP